MAVGGLLHHWPDPGEWDPDERCYSDFTTDDRTDDSQSPARSETCVADRSPGGKDGSDHCRIGRVHLDPHAGWTRAGGQGPARIDNRECSIGRCGRPKRASCSSPNQSQPAACHRGDCRRCRIGGFRMLEDSCPACRHTPDHRYQERCTSKSHCRIGRPAFNHRGHDESRPSAEGGCRDRHDE